MTSQPHRVQLSRKKGWKMPPNTVSVTRPHGWGNPYLIKGKRRHIDGIIHHVPDAETAVKLFREWLEYHMGAGRVGAKSTSEAVAELRGKNLACWCPLDQPCHADVLLELANQEGDA